MTGPRTEGERGFRSVAVEGEGRSGMRVVIGCESAVEGRACKWDVVVVRVSGERGERESKGDGEEKGKKKKNDSDQLMFFHFVSSRSRFDV